MSETVNHMGDEPHKHVNGLNEPTSAGTGSGPETDPDQGGSKKTSSAKGERKHDSGAADLERVTDFAEEKEISTENITQAMSFIGDKKAKETAERVARQRELAQVKIRREDVDLIVGEMEIPRTTAELTLRQCQGDVVQALVALTN